MDQSIQTITITVTIPGADVAGLLEKLAATVVKLGTAADSISASVAGVQTDVKEIADAAKGFRFSGPMGIHGGTA
ncbi:MAG TPA: hypothetical protein VMQ76_08425 [Terracidiphilus sp.]|jgi:hypothetical protein|nr:hypothetical protein [Terracidiphilus sp.]